MATYLHPGVFVEETLQALADPNADSSDAIAAFVGTNSKGGPVGPTLINSWSQYTALFGDVRGTSDAVSFAVYSFFNNGGSQCYIVRATNTDAVSAAITLNDIDADGAGADTVEPCLTLTAKSPGKWASDAASAARVYVSIEEVATGSTRFNLVVEVGSGTNRRAREQFTDLSMDPADPRYAITVINSPTVGSKFVTGVAVGTYGVDSTTGYVGNPAPISLAPLTGGSDGTGTPNLVTATSRLDEVDNILLVNLPGISDGTTLTSVINWAATSGNRFIVVDAPKPAVDDDAADMTAAGTSLTSSVPASSYGAVYGPWLYVRDPSSSVPGALRLIAPGGSVLGQYARNDVFRGVQKTPAGTNTGLKANNVAAKFTDAQLDSLNQAGYNVIRSVPGSGFCIMGGRTLATGTPDRYISVRRSLMYVKRNVTSLSRFAIFEPNSPTTWETVESVIEQFLNAFWQSGGLRGNTSAEAFYVKCDSDTNDPASVNAGIVNVEVGVALHSPAEFIVIRIGQFDGGTNVSDNTESEI